MDQDDQRLKTGTQAGCRSAMGSRSKFCRLAFWGPPDDIVLVEVKFTASGDRYSLEGLPKTRKLKRATEVPNQLLPSDSTTAECLGRGTHALWNLWHLWCMSIRKKTPQRSSDRRLSRLSLSSPDDLAARRVSFDAYGLKAYSIIRRQCVGPLLTQDHLHSCLVPLLCRLAFVGPWRELRRNFICRAAGSGTFGCQATIGRSRTTGMGWTGVMLRAHPLLVLGSLCSVSCLVIDRPCCSNMLHV